MKNIFIGTLLILFFQIVSAAQNQPPLEIKVGVYVIGISKISTQTSSYAMDFYLTFDCRRACEKDKDFKFEIMNGRVVGSRLTRDEPNYKEYRINAELVSNFDFRRYPFDKPELTLIIEDELFDRAKVVFETDAERTAIDAQIADFGWTARRVGAEAGEHFYPNFKQTFSSYKFSIVLERPFWASILKLLPAVAMMAACLVAFVLSGSLADRRLVLLTSALIGSVLFHINLAAGVPQVPYLTFADRFMIVNYFIISISLIIAGLLILWSDKQPAKAGKINRYTRLSVPFLWLVLHLGNALTA